MLESLPDPLRFVLDQGHLAVRTFFVLSGFVLTQTYASSNWTRHDFARYAMARFARIYPVYLLSVAAVAYFMWQTATLGSTLNYLFVLQGWTLPGAGWNTPAWSLSCEFFFYLCLPPVLLWLGRRNWWRLGALAAVALMLTPLLKRAGIPLEWKPILHLSDFVVGIVAARLYGKVRLPGYWLYVPAIALMAMVVATPAISDVGTPLRPLNGMLVLGLALGGGAIARFLSTSAAQYLGQISYSMYILHIPVLWWYGNFRSAPLYLVSVIAVSALAYECVEKPANRWLRRKALALRAAQ